MLGILFASCSTQNEIQQSAQNNENIEQYIPEEQDLVERGIINEEDIKTTPASQSSFEGNGMSFKVDSELFVYDKAPLLAQTPVADFMTITAPDSTKIQLRMLPNEIGTYKAGEGPNSYRLVDVWFTFNGVRYVADKDKGDATIELTEVGTMLGSNYDGKVVGNFEGTFVSDSGESIIVKEGYFVSEVIN